MVRYNANGAVVWDERPPGFRYDSRLVHDQDEPLDEVEKMFAEAESSFGQ